MPFEVGLKDSVALTVLVLINRMTLGRNVIVAPAATAVLLFSH